MRKHLLVCAIVALPHFAAADDEPNYWAYELTSDGKQSGTALWWEGGEEDFEGKPSQFMQQVTVIDKARMHRRTYFAATDDGVVELGTRGDVEVDKQLTHSKTVVTPPLVFIPSRFAPGTKRVVKTTTQVETNGTAGGPITIEGTVEVVGAEKVVVPAGSFECTVVRTMTTATTAIGDQRMTIKSKSDACYDVATGLVQLTSSTDTELTPKQGKPTKTQSSSTMKLSKYRVTKQPWAMQAVTAPRPAPPTEAAPTLPATAPASVPTAGTAPPSK